MENLHGKECQSKPQHFLTTTHEEDPSGQDRATPSATALPQRHRTVSPAQQSHDTAALVRNLLARVIGVEAKVRELEAEEGLTEIEARVTQLEATIKTLKMELEETRGIVEKRRIDCERLQKMVDERKETVLRLGQEVEEEKDLRKSVETHVNNQGLKVCELK
jgi:predicted RNase H-like nuclease (RuvC/YqgF family)